MLNTSFQFFGVVNNRRMGQGIYSVCSITEPPIPIVISLWFCLCSISALAQQEAPRTQPPASVAEKQALKMYHGEDLEGKDGPLSVVSLTLLRLHYSRQNEDDTSYDLVTENSFVAIDAVAKSSEDAVLLQASLEDFGLREPEIAGTIVSGWFPIARISDLGQLRSLQSVRAARLEGQSEDGNSGKPGWNWLAQDYRFVWMVIIGASLLVSATLLWKRLR